MALFLLFFAFYKNLSKFIIIAKVKKSDIMSPFKTIDLMQVDKPPVKQGQML